MRGGALLALLLWSATTTAGAATPVERFNEANALLREGRAAEAAARYGAVGVEDPDLHFNRGIAFDRAGEPGRAMVEYQRALRLDPGDGRVADSVRELARRHKSQMTLPEPSGRVGQLLDRPSLDLLSMATVLLLGVAASSVACRIAGKGGKGTLRTAAVFSVATLVAGGWWGWRVHQFERTDRGVIVAPAVATGEPGGNRLFDLPVTSLVGIAGREQGYVKVYLATGLGGWVPEERVGMI